MIDYEDVIGVEVLVLGTNTPYWTYSYMCKNNNTHILFYCIYVQLKESIGGFITIIHETNDIQFLPNERDILLYMIMMFVE